MTNIETWAAELVGSQVPFLSQGRSREGLDCWGVIWLGFKEVFNIEIPSYTECYEKEDITNFRKLDELIASYLPEWDKVDKPVVGDVVLMRLRGRPIHVGLIVQSGRMLHIEEDIEVCLESYTNTMWRHRIEGFYRHRSLQVE